MKICDSCKNLSPLQIDVIKNDEGRTSQEQLTHDYNRHVANGLAAGHVDSCPFSFAFEARQVGFTAYFVSALLFSCLCKICGQ